MPGEVLAARRVVTIPVLSRGDLDHMQCERCGRVHCSHHSGPQEVYPMCHPEAPLRLEYDDGLIVTYCAECRRPVAALALARKARGELISMELQP